MMALSDEAFEKLILDRWSHVGKTHIEHTKGLFSCGKSILQVHGCIQQEKVIVSINPSCQQKFISWLIDCEFLQGIFKADKLRVNMFKFLNI
jgi:hypothetical protein